MGVVRGIVRLIIGVFIGLAAFVYLTWGSGPRTSAEVGASTDQGSEGLLIPVAGVQASALTDTYSDARGGGTRVHHAIDIPAARGTAVLAAAAGTVEKLFFSERGGNTIYVRTPDRRHIHYYAHLENYAPGLAERQRVAQGQRIGSVGTSGDAPPDAPHLHFEILNTAPDTPWHKGEPVNPYPMLHLARTASRP